MRSVQLSRSPTVRLFGVALALAVVMADVGSIAHDLTVQHRICEHGELVDVVIDGHSHQIHGGHHQGVRAEAPPGISGSDEADEQGHEHCAAGLLARAAQPSAPMEVRAPVRATWRVPPAPLLAAQHSDIALLQLAPKASPPAAPRA